MKSNRAINYWAVIAIGFAAFALSLLWYSPFLFGEIWMRFRNAAVGSPPVWKFLVAPLREIITAIMLAYLIVQMEMTDWKRAVRLGFWLWLAFYAVQLTGAVIWDGRPWQLSAVHAGDWLMKMLFMSAALALWHRKQLLAAAAR